MSHRLKKIAAYGALLLLVPTGCATMKEVNELKAANATAHAELVEVEGELERALDDAEEATTSAAAVTESRHAAEKELAAALAKLDVQRERLAHCAEDKAELIAELEQQRAALIEAYRRARRPRGRTNGQAEFIDLIREGHVVTTRGGVAVTHCAAP